MVLVIMDVHCTESIPQSYFFSYVQRKLGFLNKNVYMSDVQCTYRASRDTTLVHYTCTTYDDTDVHTVYSYVFGLLKRHLSNGRSTKITIKIHLYYSCVFFLVYSVT